MKTVARSYHEATAAGDGNVQNGPSSRAFFTSSYDAAGRRIIKAMSGTGNSEFSERLKD